MVNTNYSAVSCGYLRIASFIPVYRHFLSVDTDEGYNPVVILVVCSGASCNFWHYRHAACQKENSNAEN